MKNEFTRVTNSLKEFSDRTENGTGLLTVFEMAPDKIQLMEKKYQKEFVSSDQLPKDFLNGDKSVLENLGVKFVQESPNDPLFYDVILPDGWHKKAKEHAYYSELLNKDGRIVATIYYCGNIYKRDANIRLEK